VWLLGGCEPSGGAGTFGVEDTTPATGEPVYSQSLIELRFSEAIDDDRCDASSVHLVALADDDAVAWFESIELVEVEPGGSRWEVVHGPLREEQEHVLVVQSGEQGCRSFLGKELEPFAWRFRVVARDP
jgi:hypothetical protein